MGVCHSWHGILQIGEKRHLFRQGDITLIPPYLPHTTWSDTGEKSRWSYLFFDSEYLFAQKQIQIQSHIPAAPEQPYCLFPAAQAAGLYALSCEILRELEQREQDYRSAALGLLQALIIKLSRLKPDPVPVDPAVNITPEAYPAGMHMILPALNELERNYTEPITISRLADLCGISETHFRRCFCMVFGISPLAYLNRLRVQKACSLLRQPGVRIISISEQCGFQTLSSFNRHFKRLTGQSPTAWRHIHAHCQNPSEILECSGWMLPEDPPR